MQRTVLFLMLSCFIFVLPSIIFPELAVGGEVRILDETIDRYMDAAAQWEPRIKEAARTMFWILAAISMVFTFAFMFARGNVGLGDFFGEFLRFIVTTGFFYWLLDNGSVIAKAILVSFTQLGLEASSTYQADLSPSNIISFALDLVVRACSTFGEQDIATSVVALALSIAIAVLFGIIAAMMVLLLCSAWVLVYAGVIYLGFGGGRWTTDIAINYFKTVLGLAAQTFTFCLLVGIGQGQIERLVTDSQASKTVTVKGYVYDSTVTTTSMTITEGCIILIFTVILFMLVKTVPQMIAGVISGASIGGIGLGGSGTALAGAAAVATGGAMVAMQAAGAGLALNSAYQQTKENMSQGAGLFSGGGGGGLSGVMSTGLRTAGDFMSNLASGAWDSTKDKAQSAKESVQSNSVGGQVSANIDAERAANKAEWSTAEGHGDGGDVGGEVDGGVSAAGGSSANTNVSGSSVSASSASVSGVGDRSNAYSVGSDGFASLGLSASDSRVVDGNSTEGSALADPISSQGSAFNDSATFDWGGRISGSGNKDTTASAEKSSGWTKKLFGNSSDGTTMDEWNSAIENYDPSKVGLIDDVGGGGMDEWNSAIQNHDPSRVGLPDDK